MIKTHNEKIINIAAGQLFKKFEKNINFRIELYIFLNEFSEVKKSTLLLNFSKITMNLSRMFVKRILTCLQSRTTKIFLLIILFLTFLSQQKFLFCFVVRISFIIVIIFFLLWKCFFCCENFFVALF